LPDLKILVVVMTRRLTLLRPFVNTRIDQKSVAVASPGLAAA